MFFKFCFPYLCFPARDLHPVVTGGVKDKQTIDGRDLAIALDYGVAAAYKAVMKPAEGTILTVSRLAAAGAAGKAREDEAVEAVLEAVDVPVVASGGAGGVADFVELFHTLPKVSAGLAASIFHFGEVRIPALKAALREEGIPVRL